MSDASLSAILNFIAPGMTQAGNTPLTCVAPYASQSGGVIDVPAATGDATVFPVGFGSVGSATLVCLINNVESAIGVRLNGADADEFEIAPGGIFLVAGPDTVATPIDEIEITTTAAIVAAGTVSYLIFGDPV